MTARSPKVEADVSQLQMELQELKAKLEAKESELAFYASNPRCAFAEAHPGMGDGSDYLVVEALDASSGSGCGFDVRLRVGGMYDDCGLNEGHEVKLHIQGAHETDQLKRFLEHLVQILGYQEVKR